MDPPPEIVPIKDILIKHKINLFYKPWASGETIADIFIENQEIKKENNEFKKENKEFKDRLKKLEDALNISQEKKSE